MICKKDIDGFSDKYVFETVALIKGYEVRPTKKGGKFFDGMLEVKGAVPFKIWSGKLYDEFEKFDYAGSICNITAEVNEFNGSKSLILTSVVAIQDPTLSESDFFEEKYNKELYMDAFTKVVQKECSAEAFSIFTEIFNDINERFSVEFAARGFHDAVRSGLLVHTYKVTFLMSKAVKFYPNIENVCRDAIILGSALHDIGKIHEYANGVIKDTGLLVSHHTFGVEMLIKHKELIVEKKGEDFFYRLLSIVEQHHGEFGETPRTKEAYLVHVIDLMESRFQIVEEAMAKGDGVISIDSYKLH